MQLHQLKANKSNRVAKRIGRGGKRGTYSGRGVKGQKARAGAKFEPAIRQWIKRYPKLRGYKFKRVSVAAQALNLDVLQYRFAEGSEVSPASLAEKRLVARVRGKLPQVKVLSRGKITKKLQFKDCKISAAARVKIIKAGGAILN